MFGNVPLPSLSPDPPPGFLAFHGCQREEASDRWDVVKALFAALLCLLPLQAFAQVAALQEFNVRMLADDESELFVNGMKVFTTAKFNEVYQTTLYLRAGDIITASVKDLQGGEGGFLLFVASHKNAEVFNAADFKYSVVVEPGWQTTPSLVGFNPPVLKPSSRTEFTGAKNLQSVWSRKQDQRYATVHFKYVVP